MNKVGYDTPSAYTGQSGEVMRVNALDAINQRSDSTGYPAFADLTFNGNLP